MTSSAEKIAEARAMLPAAVPGVAPGSRPGEISGSDLANRFTYHPPPNDDTVVAYAYLRGEGRRLAEAIVRLCPPSRETSLAVGRVEEAVMWANAAIARVAPK